MRRYLLVSLLSWWISGLALANVSVKVEPKTVQLGQTFRLTIATDEAQFSGTPDLTPLQQNFIVVGTERSMSYAIINGQTRSLRQWTLLLMPKKEGTLPIPPIQIGNQSSNVSQIKVTSSASATTPPDSQDTQDEQDNKQNSTQPDLMLKTEVSTTEPFVNQQTIYTVKLYNSRRLLDANYQPPDIDDALVVSLSDDRYQVTENGRFYAVEEQKYAVFPQKSGTLKITPPSFNALVFDAVPRKINVRAKPTKLRVKEIPTQYTGKYWLPAKQILLGEEYDKNTDSLPQGDTLVRTITL